MAIISTPLPVTLTNGTTADATQVMSDFSHIVTQVNANAAPLAGTAQLTALNVFTQPLQAAIATTRAQLPTVSQVQDEKFNYGIGAGAVNVMTMVLAPAIPAYVNGATYRILVNATNTGPVTLNINGVGAQSVLNQNFTNLIAGEMVASHVHTLTWSGALVCFLLLDPALIVGNARDADFRIQNTATPTKQIAESATLITAATTRTRTMPDKDITIADINDRHGSCILNYASATQIILAQRNGRSIMINGVMQSIGAGVASSNPAAAANYVNGVAAQTLAASTVYDVYLFMLATVPTFDFLSGAPAHSADATTGVEIHTGDATRSYVGKIVTDASSHFQNLVAGVSGATGQGLVGVISWFNRRDLSVRSGMVTTSSGLSAFPTYANIGAGGNAMFCSWLSFGDEAVLLGSDGVVSNATAAASTFASLGLDNTATPEDAYNAVTCDTAGNGYSYHVSLPVNPTEGLHTTYLLGAQSGGVGSFIGNAAVGQRSVVWTKFRG